MQRSYSGNFIAIDTETTGICCSNSEIIEVGAVRFSDWEPEAEFSTLIKPKGEIPYRITEITGINMSMVQNSPYFEDILEQLWEFIGDLPVVGHNLGFDLSFLKAQGFDIEGNGNECIDTLCLSKKIKGPSSVWDPVLKKRVYDYSGCEVMNHKLGTMCRYFGISLENAHRAADDAKAAGLLLKALVK